MAQSQPTFVVQMLVGNVLVRYCAFVVVVWELLHRAMCSCTTCSTPPLPKKWRRHGSKLFSLSFIFKTQCLIDASNNVSLLSSSRFIYFFIFSQNFLLRLASFNRFCTGSVNVKEHSGQKYLTIRPVALSGYGAIAMRLLIHGHWGRRV